MSGASPSRPPPSPVDHVLDGETYELNFIDTPGHVDFHYEVSRALAACEAAILVVDATQGVEAQTVANLYKAVDADLEIIPVINKIDLPSAQPEDRAQQVEDVLGLPAEDCIFTSAKTGQGVTELLDAICQKCPPPRGNPDHPLQALIFDAKYDDYRGVIVYFRMVNGPHEKGRPHPHDGRQADVPGHRARQVPPEDDPDRRAFRGRRRGLHGRVDQDPRRRQHRRHDNPRHPPLRVARCPATKSRPRWSTATSTPPGDTQFDELRDAIARLHVNDASYTFEPTNSEALGSGFRCGFLGMLHMDIIQERLEREGNVSVVQTAPTVTYEVVVTGKGGEKETFQITNPADLPDMSKVREIREPIVEAEIITPTDSIGDIMKLCESRRGIYKSQKFLSADRQILEYDLPLAEIIYDFFDKLKSITSGYGTVDYHVKGFTADQLVKMDVLVNGSPVEALSLIVHRSKAEGRGRHLLRRLKDQIDKHLFEIPSRPPSAARSSPEKPSSPSARTSPPNATAATSAASASFSKSRKKAKTA